jgi:hypothetical protein
MAKDPRLSGTASKVQEIGARGRGPRSLEIARAGVATADDFNDLMIALIEDVLSGNISPTAGNTVCQAGDNMLSMIRLKYRYGRPHQTAKDNRLLVLSGS